MTLFLANVPSHCQSLVFALYHCWCCFPALFQCSTAAAVLGPPSLSQLAVVAPGGGCACCHGGCWAPATLQQLLPAGPSGQQPQGQRLHAPVCRAPHWLTGLFLDVLSLVLA